MDLHEITRKYFRISLKGNEAVSVKINNVPYEVMGLNDGGIGIKLTSEDILVSVGDEFPLELKIEDMMQSLQGKVVHISPAGAEEFLCGIEFLNLDTGTKKKLLEFLESCREKIFKED
ncbi:MAG: hypothetical protein AMJ61_05610 [Desulfobacterales bacterium SG8_35_2]|jgi:Tfp pilus assembly protein PilZ|nr:MAG: hypothetical protein AMJ61_05610 [Desulfobacterales bacterium SG8_35_2]